MTEEPARNCLLYCNRIVGILHYPPNVVQNRASNDQVAIDRRLQLGVVGGVFFRELNTRLRHRDDVFQQTAGKRKEISLCGWKLLERLGVAVQDRNYQFT